MRDKSGVINAIRAAITAWRPWRGDGSADNTSAARVAELEREPPTSACAVPQLRGTPTVVLACRAGRTRRDAPRWLESVGFTVVVAADAANARQVVAEERPALVLIEASLRDSSGGLVLDALRTLPSGDSPALIAL
jgi:CheY-like chemotaxis protein